MNALLRASITRRLFVAVIIACALVWVGIYVVGRSQQYRGGTGGFDLDILPLARGIAVAARAAISPDELRIALSGIDAQLRADREFNRMPPGFLVFYVWQARCSQ